MTIEIVHDGPSPAEQVATPEVPHKLVYRCFNGPCQDRTVDAPADTVPGCATALPWQTTRGDTKYAVYVVVEHLGQSGLMFLKSYDRPHQAQQRVREITAVCSVGIQS